jgi:hypothetical protein
MVIHHIKLLTITIMSNKVPESAIEDSPPPQPQAGPSSQRNRIEESFKDFDLDSFDWNAYEGTYKGQLDVPRESQADIQDEHSSLD